MQTLDLNTVFHGVRLAREAHQWNSEMEIKINGTDRTYEGPPILGELLRHLGINPKSVAVERNLRVLARDEIEAEPVEPGDSFEIIRLVGGG